MLSLKRSLKNSMVSVHYSNYKSYLDTHCESVLGYCDEKKRIFKKSRLDAEVLKHFGRVIPDFNALLRATPEKLKEIKDHFKALSSSDQNAVKKNLDVRTLYGYFVKNENYFNNTAKGINYHSRYLSSNIEIFTCPYCNEHYTYAFKYIRHGNTIRRSYDWDHIYSKDDYPFFAISFFNLVPSCKVCNQIKLNQDADYYNPHLSINVDDVYFYDLDPVDPGFISDPKKINLQIIYRDVSNKDSFRDSISVVALWERYSLHKALISDILNKKRIYTSTYLMALKAQIPFLNSVDILEIKKTIYGTTFDNKEYYKRPFSKLTNDILRSTRV